MSGLPDARFYLDDGTGSFPIDITKLVKLEDGYAFSRGRGDTQTAPTAGTMNATLNNGIKGSVGAFTPGSTLLHTPSVIALDARIRAIEKINGSTYNRYTGYVKSWAVGWPSGTEETGVVKISCSDAQERAERRELRSVVEEEIALDSPVTQFILSEAAGATSAADTSGAQQTALKIVGTGTPVVFGTATGPATDGYTGATFANGQYLSTVLAFGSTPTTLAIGFFFTTSAFGQPVLRLTPVGASSPSPIIYTTGAGKLGITDGLSSIQNPTVTVTDGALHHGMLLITATTVAMYVDGVSMAPVAFTVPLAANVLLELGGADFTPNVTYGTFVVQGPGFQGSLEYLTAFTTSPSGARIASQANAGLTGFAGEADNARLTRLASYANIPVGSLDASLTNVPFTDITGRTVWDCIQEVANAAMGVAYIDGSGSLVFHNRQKVTTKTTPDLTLSASFVTFDAESDTDDLDLLNYLETSSSITGVTQVVRDTVSEFGDGTPAHPAHGRYPDSKDYLVSSDAEALARANWLVKTRAQPSSAGRYGTLTVNLYGMSAAQQSLVVQNLEPGCWLRIVNMPTQTPGGTTVDLVVEGINPEQSGNSWSIQCNVVSKSLYPKVFILDSSLLDGPDLLAV